MTARVEWLDVGGPVDPWRRLGLVVADDGLVPLVGTVLRLTGGAEPGITGWALSGVVACGDVDGLATEIVEEQTPRFARHELGAVALDHVVVATDSLERTSGALADATGEPLKRVREAGDLVQGFHRIGRGGLIVEIVERAGLPVSERRERTPTARASASPAATGFGGAAPGCGMSRPRSGVLCSSSTTSAPPSTVSARTSSGRRRRPCNPAAASPPSGRTPAWVSPSP